MSEQTSKIIESIFRKQMEAAFNFARLMRTGMAGSDTKGG